MAKLTERGPLAGILDSGSRALFFAYSDPDGKELFAVAVNEDSSLDYHSIGQVSVDDLDMDEELAERITCASF